MNVVRAVSAKPKRPLPTLYAFLASPLASLSTGYCEQAGAMRMSAAARSGEPVKTDG